MPERSKPHILSKFVFNTLKGLKNVYTMPPLAVLDRLFETLYFASMQSEEAQLIQVTVTFYNPDEVRIFPEKEAPLDRWTYSKFDELIPFNIKSLVKLSKAADPWSSSLAVYYNEDEELYIYGMIDQAIHQQRFVNHEIDTKPEQSGLFQVAIQGIGVLSVTANYRLIAVLRQNVLVRQFLNVWEFGPISDLLEEKAKTFFADVEQFMKRSFPNEHPDNWLGLVNNIWRDTLSRILIQIKNYRHGGALLITDQMAGLDIKYPLHYKRLRGSMLRFVKYSIATKIVSDQIGNSGRTINKTLFDRLELYKIKKSAADNELKGAIRFIASHSCVDGCIVLNSDINSYGFGAIMEKVLPPDKIYVSSTAGFKENNLTPRDPKDLGTRHRSMMTFCAENPGSIGWVLSQDGELRVMSMHANKLIVWENVKTQKYTKLKTNIYHSLSELDEL